SEEKLHEMGMRHWTLSKKYVKDGDLELALTELDLAIMNWPDMKVAHRDLCLVSLLQFNLMRSFAEFMMTVGLCDAVPMSDDESAKLVEDGLVKHYKKGMQFARLQDWPKTVNELELAAHLYPDDFAVQRSLAYAYANIGNYEKAEEHYKKTFELAPHDGSSRADLAYILAANGKVGEAQKEMEAAVKSQPKAAAYHVDLSCMAETSGDLDTARKELQEALTLSPKHAELWAHLGRVLERQGETPEALEAYKQAITLDPQMLDAKEAVSKLQQTSKATSRSKAI
ncbi:MAG: tetratricopeptide repeat protein, partial [Candidatus Obscuribacterales bacterium]|nr:tetratricopeptide repeat protein [Candidatus Obscuribacterales bacterium]